MGQIDLANLDRLPLLLLFCYVTYSGTRYTINVNINIITQVIPCPNQWDVLWFRPSLSVPKHTAGNFDSRHPVSEQAVPSTASCQISYFPWPVLYKCGLTLHLSALMITCPVWSMPALLQAL